MIARRKCGPRRQVAAPFPPPSWALLPDFEENEPQSHGTGRAVPARRMSFVTGSSTRDSGAKLTYDDLVAMPDDGLRRELIDGELYVTPSPNHRHQSIVLNLAFHIKAHLREHRIGRVFVAPLDVLFSQVDVVEPDVLFVRRQ